MEKKLYKNTSGSRRTWTHIQEDDGHTLELEPGESRHLSLPDNFNDLYLKVSVSKTTKHVKESSQQDSPVVETVNPVEEDKISTIAPKKES